MAFWTFNQNNSGGSFDFDENRGITHFVIIEADTVEHATVRAKDIGIYFDGVSAGRDCGCCGDRWYAPWKDDGSDFPEVYGTNVREAGAVETSFGGWMEDGKDACIHPLSGPIEWFGAKPRSRA